MAVETLTKDQIIDLVNLVNRIQEDVKGANMFNFKSKVSDGLDSIEKIKAILGVK